MVGTASSRAGKGQLGCLLSLVLMGAIIYYGANIGVLWFRYYQFLDEMRVQARVAPNIPDETIRNRLIRRIDELGLPDHARRLVIRRTSRPPQIEIRTEYEETVHLPLFKHTFTFRPRATAPL